jgi:outer membrane protein assembly factor BamB
MAVCAFFLPTLAARADANWPQWRGPASNGAADAESLPAEWAPDKNIVWQVDLPSWGSASPIIWDDRIYLLSPSEPEPAATDPAAGSQESRGRRGAGRQTGGATANEGGPKMMLLCLSRSDGSVIWEKEAAGSNIMFRKHNASTPSPLTDGKNIWTVTGLGAITGFDMDGNRLWTFDLTETYGKIGTRHGYASSPVVCDGKLIVQVIHGFGTKEPSYLMAFDAVTGEIAWRVERPTDALPGTEALDAYTTPIVLEIDGKPQVVVVGADYVTAYNPANGDELWRVGGLNPENSKISRIVASPLLFGDVIFCPTRKGPVLALDAVKSARKADDSVIWTWNGAGSPDVPTPTTDGDFLYMATDNGSLVCLDAKTGQTVWGPEETGLGTTSASPVLADDKIYLIAESGVTAVVATGPQFKLLAKNDLDGSYTLASPAVSGDRLYIRTAERLYCIGNVAATP